jgi:hypothetical protein
MNGEAGHVDAREWLEGAWDAHLHVGPDVVPRAQDAFDLMRDAAAAGMAAVCLKDHTGCTAGMAAALARVFPDGPRCIGSVTLNPTNGGLNPAAAERALRLGARVVWFPTYGAAHHVRRMGRSKLPLRADAAALTVLDAKGRVVPAALEIAALIREYDAVLATGHLSPEESLALLRAARSAGVKRLCVTHASEPVTDMGVAMQKEAAALGATLEHSLLALTPTCRGGPSPAAMAAQMAAVGPEHIVLSSDFGQVENGPPVAAFARWLAALHGEGLGRGEIGRMIRENPARLLA